MPCRAPLKAVQKGSDKPMVFSERPRSLAEGYRYLELPCGQCRGCKLEYSRQWGCRIADEAQFIWEMFNLPSSFITLTYAEKWIPDYGTLLKDDLQKFIKRLRRRIEPQKIRYYAAGEYGTRCPKHEIHDCLACGSIQRPHYHAIILGYDFPDRQYVGDREGLCVYHSEFLEDVWKYGFHEIGSVSFESAAYVARYVMKKITGPQADDGHYMRHCWKRDSWFEVEPEFALMSTNPGIGRGFAEKYQIDHLENDEYYVAGRGKIGKMPKYYLQLYEDMYPEYVEKLKEDRREAFAKSLVDGPSLEARARVQDAKIDQLRRNM